VADIFFSNTLSHKKEKFESIKPHTAGIYSCGPTVYWNQHIGHMYAYVQWDTLVRFLRQQGYTVKWVMNITDVGHLTSDEDTGEDKMEKGARREGISVWELADKYIKQFNQSLKLLNISKPDVMPRATEHIKEQIALIEKIQKKGFAYRTKMGLLFDTAKFPKYSQFAQLDLGKQQQRADVVEDPEKKNSSDFFLWVTGNSKHVMQWESPWGRGFPGWHIECTAMSVLSLGEKFDIHTGGIEHIPVHHTNEIAQAEAAFGSQTANYWLHNGWLIAKGGIKMSKTLGNYVTVEELVDKGYDPLALRYLILTSHYKKGLTFSYEALDGAAQALRSLREIVAGLKASGASRRSLSGEKLQAVEKYQSEFVGALADDLNVPVALATLWEVLKSSLPATDKYDLAMSFDEILGLNLAQVSSTKYLVSDEIKKLVEQREKLRKEGKFEEADEKRKQIEKKGFIVEDSSEGPKIKPKR
jgi:cysteinyl-tRNA synthetase